MEVAAEMLLRKVPIPDLVGAAAKFLGITVGSSYEQLALVYEKFIKASPDDKCRICVLALKGETK